MSFHATVGIGRGYDLAFTGTNPQNLRLMMPSGAGLVSPKGHVGNETKLLISLYYSNPQKLEVHYKGAVVPPIDGVFNSYNFSMTKPTADSPWCALHLVSESAYD